MGNFQIENFYNSERLDSIFINQRCANIMNNTDGNDGERLGFLLAIFECIIYIW